MVWYGAFVRPLQDLDKDELEELKTKHRLMVTRGLAEFIHVSPAGHVFVTHPIFCYPLIALNASLSGG